MYTPAPFGAPATQFQQPQAPGAMPYATDPHSAYLVQALQSLGQAPERSPAALGENLLADALDQVALKKAQTPGQQGGQGFQLSPRYFDPAGLNLG